MTDFRPSTALLASLLLSFAAASASGASLLEIYQQAVQSDPLIHEAEARRLATLEASPQARGLLFPQITGNASFQTSDSDGTQLFQDTVSGLVSTPFTGESDVLRWDISIRQTVFRWDQIVGLQQAGKRVAQAEADYEAAQQDLIIRVATRYFDVLAAEDVLDVHSRGSPGDRPPARAGATTVRSWVDCDHRCAGIAGRL